MLLAVVGVLGIAVIYTIDPRNLGSYPICPFLGLIGYHCPGCGTLRALHQLCHGDIVSALGYNPFTISSLPFTVFSYVSGITKAFRLPTLPAVFISHQWIWALLVGLVAFWVLRNVPIDPLTVLAP